MHMKFYYRHSLNVVLNLTVINFEHIKNIFQVFYFVR